MEVGTVAEREAGPSRAAGIDAGRVAFFVGVSLLAVLGLVLRLHLLASQPLDGDESVTGLMADQALHGHFYTFFWGQQYAGGEFYPVALLFALFGSGPVVLNGTPVLLTAVAAVLLWLAVLTLVPEHRWVASLVAVLFWVWPEAAVWNSTRELGIRALTMVAGMAAIVLTFRMIDDWSLAPAAGLGLSLGVGWWSSPEIIYFAVIPAVIIPVQLLRGQGRMRLRTVGAMLVGVVVGALPWIWTNFHTGFASLSSRSSPVYTDTTYTDRLSLFFHKVLPMMLGLRRTGSGVWVGGLIGQALYVVALLVLITLCLSLLWRARRPAGLAAGAAAVALLLFPLEYAAFPATSFWQDGRFGLFCVPLLLLVAAASLPKRLPSSPAVAAVAVIAVTAALALTLSAYDGQFMPRSGLAGLVRDGPNPNRQALAAIDGLEANGVRYAYADYGVAYVLDFLSHQRLRVTDPGFDRWAALYREVRTSGNPAWIFDDPKQVSVARKEFASSAPAGPYGYTEAAFIAKLTPLHISYRIIPLGALDAVVTSNPVRQEQVGMGPPRFP